MKYRSRAWNRVTSVQKIPHDVKFEYSDGEYVTARFEQVGPEMMKYTGRKCLRIFDTWSRQHRQKTAAGNQRYHLSCDEPP